MNLDCKIMAHPSRKASVRKILSKLDREVEVIWDENPIPSANPEQRWQTGRRAWAAVDTTADFGLVLQDDVLICRDLIAGLEKALDQLGTAGLVSAYTGTGRPEQHNVARALEAAAQGGHAWASTRSLNWGPAIILPTSVITDMLTWCDTRQCRNYDHRLGLYCRDILRWRTWYTVPSLVDHAAMPSLVGHDTGPQRRAHQFHGTRRSALTIDWTATPDDFTPLLPR